MPLQNRVDPFGNIHAVAERGMFTGNRGIIHDPDTRTLLTRRWASKAWIVCRCEFRNVRRDPMGRNRVASDGTRGAGWTELFFLDEVTALAAGHRPCFFCRRERAEDFIGRFGDAFGIAEPRAPMLDGRLHAERLASGGRPAALDHAAIDALPDGAMLFQGQRSFAKYQGKLRAWTFGGWIEAAHSGIAPHDIFLLTPPTTVEILRHGYKPVWHPSAAAGSPNDSVRR